MTYIIPQLVTSYAIVDLYDDASGFASVNSCDPFNNAGNLGFPPDCTPGENPGQ